MTTPKNPLEDAALALYYRAAELLKAGKRQEEVIWELTKQGVKRETAQKMLARIAESQRRVEVRQGWRNVFVGGVLTFFALGLTFGWFGFAPANGLAIFPTLAGLGAGCYWLVRGLLQLAHF